MKRNRRVGSDTALHVAYAATNLIFRCRGEQKIHLCYAIYIYMHAYIQFMVIK